jgi:hypothetical protein
MTKQFGSDLNKWLIRRVDGEWYVMPPQHRDDNGNPLHDWSERGATITTGAQALAAFHTISIIRNPRPPR